MATKKSAVAVIGLAEIVAAGANGMFVPESVYAPLVEAGLVVINQIHFIHRHNYMWNI